MMTIADFKAGDILILTKRHSQRVNGEVVPMPNTEHKVEVTVVNYNGNGLVTYSGIDGTAGQGAFDPTHFDNPSRFETIIGARKIGWRKPWEPFHPDPRDPHYSNM